MYKRQKEYTRTAGGQKRRLRRLADRLERHVGNDAQRLDKQRQTLRPHCIRPDFQHLSVSLGKQLDHLRRKYEAGNRQNAHHHKADDRGKRKRLLHPLVAARAVIETDNRLIALTKADQNDNKIQYLPQNA